MADKKKDKASAHGAPRDSSMKVQAHPPSHFLGSCVATVVLGSWKVGGPRFMVFPQQRIEMTIAGIASFAGSSILALVAFKTFRKYKTPIPHGYQVQTIVSEGVFRFSRNPMYLSMVLGVASLGLTFNTRWGAVAALYLAATLHWFVIPFEEAYLTKQFGKAYEDYRVRVPRWILFI